MSNPIHVACLEENGILRFVYGEATSVSFRASEHFDMIKHWFSLQFPCMDRAIRTIRDDEKNCYLSHMMSEALEYALHPDVPSLFNQ